MLASHTLPQYRYFDSQLPWSSGKKENAQFLKVSVLILIITVLFALFVALRELPEVPRAEQEKLPPQLAKILEAKTPPPPPIPIEPEPIPEPEL